MPQHTEKLSTLHTTATVDPLEVLHKLASVVVENGARIYKGTKFLYPLGKV